MVGAKEFERIKVHLRPHRTTLLISALREEQQKELSKWHKGGKFDREWLHVARDGVPNHFEAMDGSEMRIFFCGQ